MSERVTIESNTPTTAQARHIHMLRNFLIVSRWAIGFGVVISILTAMWFPESPFTLGGDPMDPDDPQATAFFGVTFDETTSHAGLIAETIEAAIYGVFLIFALTQVLRILQNVLIGASFASENGLHLRRIAFGGIAAQLGVYAVWITFSIIGATTAISVSGMTLSISFMPWLGILTVFSLATIFRQGTELKEEQDLTV